MLTFTANLLGKIVSSAVLKVKERKEFDANLRNEITGLRVRSFSYAKDIVKRCEIKDKQIKSKSLCKEINRSCQENDHQRQE